MARTPTNWDTFEYDPHNPVRKLFLGFCVRAYIDILNDVERDKPISILEFGCGTGYNTLCLCKTFSVKKVTLLDFNQTMLDLARKTLEEVQCEKHFVKTDFFEYQVDEEHDFVHSQGVIEHFEEPKRVELMRRHFKATSPTGSCVIYSPTPEYAYPVVSGFLKLIGKWNFPDEVPLTKQQLVSEGHALGMRAVRTNYYWKHFLTEVGVLFRHPNTL